MTNRGGRGPRDDAPDRQAVRASTQRYKRGRPSVAVELELVRQALLREVVPIPAYRSAAALANARFPAEPVWADKGAIAQGLHPTTVDGTKCLRMKLMTFRVASFRWPWNRTARGVEGCRKTFSPVLRLFSTWNPFLLAKSRALIRSIPW